MYIHIVIHVFPGGSVVKNLLANAGDTGSVPGSGRSPGIGNGNPVQFSCLENPKDRGTCQAVTYGITKNQTRLSMHSNTYIHIMHTYTTASLYK